MRAWRVWLVAALMAFAASGAWVGAWEGEEATRLGLVEAKALVAEAEAFTARGEYDRAIEVYQGVARDLDANPAPEAREVLASALTGKAEALGRKAELPAMESETPDRSKWRGEAIAMDDEILRRFGQETAPALSAHAAWALHNKGLNLEKLGRRADAVAVWKEVEQRFGQGQAPAIRRWVAMALVDAARVRNDAGKDSLALDLLDEVEQRFGQDQTTNVREEVARAMAMRGYILSKSKGAGAADRALAAYDATEARFSRDDASAVWQWVGVALIQKATLVPPERTVNHVLALLGEIEHRLGRDAASGVRAGLIKDVLHIVHYLSGRGKDPISDVQEIALYDAIVERFSRDASSQMRRTVISALSAKAWALSKSKDRDGAVAALDRVVVGYGQDPDPETRAQAANAIVTKGAILLDWDDIPGAMAAFGEVKRRYGGDPHPSLLRAVEHAAEVRRARAKNLYFSLMGQRDNDRNKTLALCSKILLFGGQVMDSEPWDGVEGCARIILSDADDFLSGYRTPLPDPTALLAALGDVARLTGQDDSPKTRELAAGARLAMGRIMPRVGNAGGAVVVLDEVIQRYDRDTDPRIRAHVAKALYERGNLLTDAGDLDGARAAYDQVERRYGREKDGDLRGTVIEAVRARGILEGKALVQNGRALARSGDLDRALASFDEVKRRFDPDKDSNFTMLNAEALFAKGQALEDAGRLRPALDAYSRVLNAYGYLDSTPAVREWTAKTLLGKASVLRALGETKAELGAYDEFFQFYDKDSPLRHIVAEALVRAAAARARLGDTKIALALCDTIESRFGQDTSPYFRELTATNHLAKARILADAKAPAQALETLDALMPRLAGASEPALRETERQALALTRDIRWGNGEYRKAFVAAWRLYWNCSAD